MSCRWRVRIVRHGKEVVAVGLACTVGGLDIGGLRNLRHIRRRVRDRNGYQDDDGR